jgi:hypothetical protein
MRFSLQISTYFSIEASLKKCALETAFDSTGPKRGFEGRASRLHNGTRTSVERSANKRRERADKRRK